MGMGGFFSAMIGTGEGSLVLSLPLQLPLGPSGLPLFFRTRRREGLRLHGTEEMGGLEIELWLGDTREGGWVK